MSGTGYGFPKGPWGTTEVTFSKKDWAGLNDGSPFTVVRANWDGWTGDILALVWGDGETEEKKTARAIAALPELVGALEEAEAGLEFAGADKDIPDGDFVPAPTAALRIVRAILSKLRERNGT